MENVKCWDCKYLGSCELSDGNLKNCNKYVYYKDSNILTKKRVSELLTMSERSVFRYLEKTKYILENLEKITGKKWTYKKSSVDNQYYIMEVKRNE